MSQHASTITLPSHWACYLINGDASGLDDGEAERIAAHLKAELPPDAAIVDVIEDSERFTWSFRLYGGDASGGDVADFTVLQPGARAAVQRAGADDAPAMVSQQAQQQQASAAAPVRNVVMGWADDAVTVPRFSERTNRGECHRDESCGVRLIQTGKDRFTVVYGKQVKAGLSYAQAAAEYGRSVMHALACEGMLDNRERGER